MATGPLFIYDNRFRDAVPVASTTAAGYDVQNLGDMRDYTWWQPTALPATITVNCGSAKTADSAAIYRHNLFTCGCSVELRKSSDNFAANDVLVDSFTPSSDKPIVRVFSSASAQYWRWKFTGAGAMPTLAIAPAGNRLEIPVAGPKSGYDPTGYRIVGQYNRSIEGRPLGRVISYRDWKQTLNFENVSWSWVRATWQVAAAAWGEGEPFLFAWNPDAYPNEVYHVGIQDEGWKTPHKMGSFADLVVPLIARIPD